MTKPRVWFKDAFGALYPILYAHRTVERAGPEAKFAAAALNLSPQDTLLDLCCGGGRHLKHLAPLVGLAVGLDYSPDLLAMARMLLPGERFVRGDMRAIPFENVFDVVTNFFTSFGYFEQEEENLATARGIARALKPGGRFLIDHMNALRVERNLLRRNVRTAQGFEIHERRWIDEARRVHKGACVYREGAPVYHFEESVCLYTEDEIRDLLYRAGLVVEKVFGELDGKPFSSESTRMVVIGRKAAV